MNSSSRFQRWFPFLFPVLSLFLFSGAKSVYADTPSFPSLGDTCLTSDPPALLDIVCVFVRVIQALFQVVGGLAMLYLIIGAIRFITAGEDEKALDQAKKAITYAILGMLVAWGAVFIVDAVGQFLGIKERLPNIRIP